MLPFPIQLLTLFVVSLAVAHASAAEPSAAMPIKVGIIGLDTSHVIAFTKALNNPDAPAELRGVRVVVGYPGGSPDVESSATRVEGFTQQLRTMGIEIVDSIDALLAKCDAVLLESVDGRPHLEQVKPVFASGKPVFIDKPVAGSLADAIAIYRLSERTNVPCFSSSSLRFSPEVIGVRSNKAIGDVLGCVTYGPCSLEPHHPDLFWYGVHGVEMLFTIMGTGCKSVTRTSTADTDVVTGVWSDGRVGTFRGLRAGKAGYGAIVFGVNDIKLAGERAGYDPLLVEIVKFFKTGKPPVTPAETLEIMAFMEAADESKRQGGVPVTIAGVIERADQERRSPSD